jgi:hypothetical protein
LCGSGLALGASAAVKYGIEYPTLVRALAKVPRLGSRVGALHASWLNLKYELFWQLLKNPASRRRFGAQPSQLDMTARKVVDALRRDGIAFVPVTDLFEDTVGLRSPEGNPRHCQRLFRDVDEATLLRSLAIGSG